MAFALPFNIPEYDAAVAEIDKQEDRGAAIIAMSFLEEHLLKAILSRFRHRSNDVEGQLLKGYGPLASFKSKIDLGFLLGLYSMQSRARLMTMKEVRNRFAHRMKPLDFEHRDIRDLCDNLPCIEEIGRPWLEYGAVPDQYPTPEGTTEEQIQLFRAVCGLFATHFTSLGSGSRARFMAYFQSRTMALALVTKSPESIEHMASLVMHL